jgi:ABC-type hemin transport system ATPase subunit
VSVRLRNLTCSYSGRRVLSGLSLDIAAGEFVASVQAGDGSQERRLARSASNPCTRLPQKEQ